jgi:hypothetical protein
MKDVKKKAEKLSKMSLAARKAWETRRKNKGIVKEEKGREKSKEVNEEAEVVVEQLKRAYRKGRLVNKGKRVMRKGSVKMDEKWMMYLYGSDWLEKVVIRKLVRYAKDLMGSLIFEGRELEVPKVVIQR